MSKNNPTSFGKKGQSTVGTIVVLALAVLGWWFNGSLPGVDPGTTESEQAVSQAATATLAPLTEEGEGAVGDTNDTDSNAEDTGEDATASEPEPVADAAAQPEEESSTEAADASDSESSESSEPSESSETEASETGDASGSEVDEPEEAAVVESSEDEAAGTDEKSDTEEEVVDTPTPEPLPTDTPTPEPTATPVPQPTSTPTPDYPRGPPGMPEIMWEDLPPEARVTIELIWQNGPFPYRKDDSTFQNREGRLPQEPRDYYREFTVETPGSRDRGARRIVEGENGELYYTDDHYDSFSWVVIIE